MDYPKLRNVEVFPLEMEGQSLICFRDPLRIAENIVLLPRQALPIISLFDGKHSIRDIQAEYMRAYGHLLYSDQILEVALSLDEHYLLDSTRFQTYREQLEEEFRRSSVRRSIMAGTGYDENPDKLRVLLDSFFCREGGPGEAPACSSSPRGLKGFVAPHIDYTRGGPCYAWAYKEVAEHSTEEVFVLLGTSHVPTKRHFVLTRKDFETPFALLCADHPLLNRLEEQLGAGFFDDELIHRNEHSLEFQAVYLTYLFAQKRNVTIVPVLCGSFHDLIARGGSPRDNEEINAFLETLRDLLAEDGRRFCLVAGADLAHVGPQFGDRYEVTPALMDVLKVKDRAMLDCVVNGDAEGFYHYVRRENDERKICGLPPIYALLSLLQDGAQGKLLNYRQWRDPGGQGAVTFASLAFY